MPTYEYGCKVCGNIFEVFQSIAAEPLKRCPKCGGEIRRLISKGVGVIFKGSGFYTTDYRSPGYKKKEKEEANYKKKGKEEKCQGKKEEKESKK